MGALVPLRATEGPGPGVCELRKRGARSQAASQALTVLVEARPAAVDFFSFFHFSLSSMPVIG